MSKRRKSKYADEEKKLEKAKSTKNPVQLKKSLKSAVKSQDNVKIDKAAGDINDYLITLRRNYGESSSDDENNGDDDGDTERSRNKVSPYLERKKDQAAKYEEFFEIISTCVDANHPVCINILYELVYEFPTGIDFGTTKRRNLTSLIFDTIVTAKPSSQLTVIDETSEELYEAYKMVFIRLDLIGWPSDDAASESMDKFQNNFMTHQTMHLARIASLLHKLDIFKHYYSKKRRFELLSDISEVLKVQKSKPDRGSKEFRELCKDYFCDIFSNVLESSELENYSADEKDNFFATLQSIIENTMSMTRPGWWKPINDEFDSKQCEDSSENVVKTKDDEEKQKGDSESMTTQISFDNCNFFELLLDKALHEVMENEKLELVIKSTFGWLLQRVELAQQYVQCGQESKSKDCACDCDSITKTALNCIVLFIVQHPRSVSKYNDRLAKLFIKHLNTDGMIVFTKLFVNNSLEVDPYFERLFRFGMKLHLDSFCDFVMTAARYESNAINNTHVDELEDLLLSEKCLTVDISMLLDVLEAISLNKTELMHGRGTDYFEAIVRNLADQQNLWITTDCILECIGTLDESEARRVMNIFVKGCKLIPDKLHVMSVLDQMLSLAMVHRNVVNEFKEWIDEKLEDPITKKQAVKLVIILQGDPVAGAKRSSTCSLS